MPKRIKKPAVRPEVRRQWFKRFEEDGETPPRIAETEGYDVRTVRKQIELARQEREEREARTMVLRGALEQHYADLVAYAETLDAEITKASLPLDARSVRLQSALRQHLPRSPLWKALDRVERLNVEINNVEKRLEDALPDVVKEGGLDHFGSGYSESGLDIEGAVGGLIHYLKHSGDTVPPVPKVMTLKEGVNEVYIGPWKCSVTPSDQIPDVETFMKDMMSKVITLPDSEELKNRLAALHRAIEAIREELATITMKRIVPGRCKYCPL